MSAEQAIVRRATLADAPAIQSLYLKLMRFEQTLFRQQIDLSWPQTRRSLRYTRDSITKRSNLAMVAEVNGRIVGYLIATIYPGPKWRRPMSIAELQLMFVEPRFRSHRLGGRLVEAYRAWATTRGADRLKVVATASNTRAIAFYHRHGFADFELSLEQPASA